MINILWQLQLSNYTADGQFIFSADSNWQLFTQKAVQIAKLSDDITIDVIVPNKINCQIEDPEVILKELGIDHVVNVIHLNISPNALVTRFDFDWNTIKTVLNDKRCKKYTHVYINDPMLLRHYKALFYINKCNPKFILQTHFLDSPVARIVSDEISYWHGTVEACMKSDIHLWHCNSMLKVFEEALHYDYNDSFIEKIMSKSGVWKDGYSTEEIKKGYKKENLRFDIKKLDNKCVVWIPNRIGGLGRSFDYTNNGKFMFDYLPKLWEQRQDFIVVAGNPNQKISNDELTQYCPAYCKLIDGPLNRDEYRYLSERSDIVAALYTNDTNGGLACLEAIEHKSYLLAPDIYEYSVYYNQVDWPQNLRVNSDLSNINEVLSKYIDLYYTEENNTQEHQELRNKEKQLKEFIREYASYESTTPIMINKLFR